MTYSIDFRRHVLSVRERECLTFQEVADRLSVGVASVVRWNRGVVPKPYIRKHGVKIDMEALARDVRNDPDAYQYERAARFGVSRKAIWKALRKLEITHKKAMRHPKADEARRQDFPARIAAHQAKGKPVVNLDESGFSRGMPRTHGYAPRGQRCIGGHDWHARGRVNALGAILAGVLLTVGLTTSNVDAEIFNLWLESDLLPKLPPGAVIVLDNASFHKRADTEEMIKIAGHYIEFFPQYSPDLSPIEPKWAQTKAIIRRTGMSPDQIFAQTF